MKKFLLIYWANLEAFERWKDMSEQQQKQEMQEWFEWMQENSENFVDAGNPVGKNTRVTNNNTVEEVSNEVAGYSILSAKDKNDALKILKWNPHTKTQGTYIELMEIVDMEM